jgi:hypothetical protein
LGLVQRQGKRWAAAEFVASPVDGAPNGDVRKAHRQLTELSLRSLEYEPLSERSHTAVYLPCDASQIETAREMIRDFRRNFEKALFHQRSAVPTRVYCLSVQFFGLDRPETPPLADNSKTGRST